MTTFVEDLERTLSSIERTKEFIHSPETLRAVALKRKKWHVGLPADVVVLIGIVILCPVALLLWGWGFPPLATSLVLGGAGGVWGMSQGVNVLLRKWKKKAALHGLGSHIGTKKDFANLNKTLKLSEQVEIVEECQRAGASANQINRLYVATSEDLPCAWWDTVYDAACRETKRLNAEQIEQTRFREQQELHRRAQEKIQAHLNRTVEVEHMWESQKTTKDELCSGIKL